MYLFSFLGKENVNKMFHFSFWFIWQENCPNLIDLDVSGTNIRKIHIEKLQVCFCLLSSIETVTLFSCILSGRMGTGPCHENPRVWKVVVVYIQDRGFSNFAYNMMIKLSVKWAGLLAWSCALFLKILIWIFDFGPEKLAWETRHRAVRVMFYIFFRSLCSWWDVLPKNNSASQ